MLGRISGRNSVFWAICNPANKSKFSATVKNPLMKAIIHFANLYPKPSRDNLFNENSVLLLEIKEWFEAHDNNEIRTQMFLAAFDIAIVEYDHDIYYRRRADAAIKKIVELVNDGRWKFNNGEPDAWPYAHCWNTPNDKEVMYGEEKSKDTVGSAESIRDQTTVV